MQDRGAPPETRVLVRGVVDHQVDDHPDSALLGRMREFDELTECSVARIDLVVVRNVVAIIATGRGLEGHQPDGGHSKSMKIVEPPHEPGEVPHSVAIGVHVGGYRKAIDDRVLVPKIIDHGRIVRIRPTVGNCQPSC